MAVGPKGTLFVGTRADSVYAVEDKNGDKTGDAVHVIADGLVQPNGVEVHDGDLYVGEIFRITRYDDIEDHLDDPGEPAIVNDTYPTDTHHGWKFIKFGPDGKLYIPVGAPCNVCEKKDERFATITRVDADGKNFEIYSRGIRNTVGFDWHPKTGKLWFTDNGRDMLGDDIPPDELNSAPEPGMHFGFPYCHGGTIDDPVFGEARTCAEFTKPKHNFHAHVAALGMRFYDGDQFPGDYTNQIFVCQHGSWNRSEKIGYRVMLVNVDEAGETVTKVAPFIEGWLQGESVWGRPVDVQVMPDGALMVSDDRAGVVYRVYYKK
ncbi:MAG: sorbosone dehydrogenase family protein [Deltaproteobacteria bacterium]|nr:sorbosone dehydrogenase family protein [Deltaproteobacteria bacterium]